MSKSPKTAAPSSLLLSPEKAADYLGVSRTTLRKLAVGGSVEYRRLNGRRMFTAKSLHKFVEKLAA